MPQAPPLHLAEPDAALVSGAGQTLLQSPQWSAAFDTSMQLVPQSLPWAQVFTQPPTSHTCVALHFVVQARQESTLSSGCSHPSSGSSLQLP